MLRSDGRRSDEMRPIVVAYEKLDRVDGSARFAFGETETTASVSGPLEARASLESPSQATLDIHIRPLASVPGTDSRAFATILKTVLAPSLLLSHNPRTLIQLVGQALCGSDSGSGTGTVGHGWNISLMASLINASTAAFVNSGSIPMRGVVCAVAIGRLPNGSSGEPGCTLVLDPSEIELPKLEGGGCFAFLFSATTSKSLVQTEVPAASLLWRNYSASNGSFDETEFANAQSLARHGAEELWHAMKRSLPGTIDPPLAQHIFGRSASLVEGIDDENMEI
ncbi:hypothetical protein BDW22DRAFT_1363464 [Trametopsis cervina]|nr:hypothetical protein BDW22DRAFT_1363464 [Trametopsis cervina]